MVEALFAVGLLAVLPIVHLHGKRACFNRHHCVQVASTQDRAPQTFVVVQCSVCDAPVDCALQVHRSFVGGVSTVTATVDPTDLEHRTLTHVDEVRRTTT